MNRSERTVLLATLGLAVAAVGTFLPWARIGGRNRSGFSTADTFIALGDGLLPGQVSWVGRWWYLPAVLALLVWVSTFFAGRTWLRVTGVVLLGIGLAMWWLFVWAGERYGVLDVQLLGPIIATAGVLGLAIACAQSRTSIVRPPSAGPVA